MKRRVAIAVSLVALLIAVAVIFWRPLEHPDPSVLRGKVDQDYAQFWSRLGPLQRAWRKSAESPTDSPATLVIDLRAKQVRLIEHDRPDAVGAVSLPDGYTWTVYQVTPDACRALEGTVLLRLPGSSREYNSRREVVALQGRLDADDDDPLLGLHVSFRLPGSPCGVQGGDTAPDWQGHRFQPTHPDSPRRIDKSLLVSEESAF